MTTDYKSLFGYRLMLAFEGVEVPDRIRTWLTERKTAGFTLFRPLNVQNPTQVRALTAELQAIAAQANQPPLIIATDQEGGQLNALGEEMTLFPGNMALGATRDADLARQVGQALGRELAALGVNVNYAPNCDINTHPNNPACGARAFGDDPALAAALWDEIPFEGRLPVRLGDLYEFGHGLAAISNVAARPLRVR